MDADDIIARGNPIVGADVAGGFVGGLGGSIVPGVGTLAGALGGACLGSMGKIIEGWF